MKKTVTGFHYNNSIPPNLRRWTSTSLTLSTPSSIMLSGRRRAVFGVANRSPNNNEKTGVENGGGNNNKSCNHGCDCKDNKYRKGIDAAALFKQCLIPLFAILFLFGIITTMKQLVGSSRTSSLVRKQFPSSPTSKIVATAPQRKLPSSSSSSKIAAATAIAPPPTPTTVAAGNCDFRTYPKRRYYGLNDALPDFLEKTEYIYGELPLLLHPKKMQTNPVPNRKLCVDQSEWLSDTSTLPFADGTNPSILKIDNNPRIDPSIRELLLSAGTGKKPYYVATICMTDSQCSWNDTPEEIHEFRLSKDKQPLTVRTVLLLLTKHFETIAEATIYTKIDAPFGKIKKPKANQIETFKLDDARLFTHRGEIWVSYREGKHFGYDKQVLNKLHFRFDNKKELSVALLASDTETLCCGRNMALIDNVRTNELQALTWVDPVTVVDVDVSKTDARLAEQKRHRRLKEKGGKKKSHFHGTNGFMVHLPGSEEYLGIGHFHRPPGRDKNEYARFGHHYTHAFFTISDQPPFRLKRLSPELLIESFAHPDDAEIIQFWSGLELDGDELALAYGINDCEAAALHINLAFVEGLLRDVPAEGGKEVVDFMMPVKK